MPKSRSNDVKRRRQQDRSVASKMHGDDLSKAAGMARKSQEMRPARYASGGGVFVDREDRDEQAAIAASQPGTYTTKPGGRLKRRNRK